MITTTRIISLMLFLLVASGLQAREPIKLLPTMGGAPVVDTGSNLPFNRNSTPVADHDLKLLTQHGYRFGEKGGLFPPGSTDAVSMNDYFYVVEEVRSRQRLQALLRIQLIQSKNSFSKDLPKVDRDKIRSIARDNWHLLSHRTRMDLESLFSNKEIFDMKQLPSAAPMNPLTAPSTPIELGNLPAGVVIPTDKAINTLAGPIMPLGIKNRTVKRSPVRRKKRKPKPKPKLKAKPKIKPKPLPTLAAVPKPPPGWNAATRGTVKPLPPPWEPDPAIPVKPLPAPWKKFKRAKERLKPVDPVPAVKAMPAPWANEPVAPTPIKAPPAKPQPKPALKPIPEPQPEAEPEPEPEPEPTTVAQDPLPEEGFTPAERAMRSTMASRNSQTSPEGFSVEAPEPPPVVVARGMVPISPAQVKLPPPFIAPPQPKEIPVEYPEIDSASFSKFLETAPYSKEIKPLLSLIAKHLREPERKAAIGILATTMPQIIIDSRKAGESARASIGRIQRGASFARTQVALHDGPVLTTEKSLFSSNRAFFMPDDSNFYAARGKSMPAQEAYSRDSVSVRNVKGEWGTTRLYKDGSTRVKRSEHAIAGALLNALMRIDGDLRGWVDDYHNRLRAEAVEFRFYRSIKADTEKEPELDPELSARYHEWFHRPEDYLDLHLNSFFERTREEELALLGSAGVEGIGKSGPPTEFRLPPADSPAKRAWLASDKLSRGKE